LRSFDIATETTEAAETIRVTVNGDEVHAVEGETVLSTLIANGYKDISLNDHKKTQGAYCGMGICHACLVTINGKAKQRACLALIQENSHIETQSNLFTTIMEVNNERA